MMNDLLESDEINNVKKLLDRDLHISEIIRLAYTIRKLIKYKGLDFISLIDPIPSIQWENIARILPYLPDQILIENFDYFLEWFQDTNWYGVSVLQAYMEKMDKEVLKEPLGRALKKAREEDDSEWIYFLLAFIVREFVDLGDFFKEEIISCKQYLMSKGAIEEGEF